MDSRGCWPDLRQELGLHPGPTAEDGSPTWTLHDPVSNRFVRVDWPTFEMLARWSRGSAEGIAQAIRSETALDLDTQDVESLVSFLRQHDLLQDSSPLGTERRLENQRRRNQSVVRWVLHRYLFFRVPLWNPNRALECMLPWVRPLFSPTFRILTWLALVMGLFQISRQWDVFRQSVTGLVSIEGLLSLLGALLIAKIAHEFGHALAAKHYGCRVPTMGVAFLLLLPMAYTDVNDVWKLPDSRKRLAVGSAGIRTELVIAVWATLAWSLLPDGSLRHACLILATTTWVSTLLVNASPFLRFDGYFLLMDWLGIPNLHQRAFAFGRWQLRRLLFASDTLPPEPVSAGRRWGLVLFAWLTWLYRLVVFVGIAFLIYSVADKPIGPLLAAIELWWFIGKPVLRELAQWPALLLSAVRRSRAWLVWLGLGALIGLVLVPWDTRVSASASLRASSEWTLRTPNAAKIIALHKEPGSEVREGDPLLTLDAPELALTQRILDKQADRLRWQLRSAGVAPTIRDQLAVIEHELARLQADVQRVDDERARFELLAPGDGHFFLNEVDLTPGTWLGADVIVGLVRRTDQWTVTAWLPEDAVLRIRPGAPARFHSETPGLYVLDLVVREISRDAVDRLSRDVWLAQAHGGDLAARPVGSDAAPAAPLYRVVLTVDGHPAAADRWARLAGIPHRGQVVIRGQPEAWLTDVFRSVGGWLLREVGF